VQEVKIMLLEHNTSGFSNHHVVSEMQPWLLFAALLPVIVIKNNFLQTILASNTFLRSFATAPMEQQQPNRQSYQ
jgi:hypothetical protein